MGANYTVSILREDIDLLHSRYVFEHYLNPPFLVTFCWLWNCGHILNID